MPWKESVVMDERLQFVRDALRDRFTMSELCARYGVSRRIGYKWLARYEADGRRGLVDQSRAPHHCPHTIAPRIAEFLIAARQAHPYWGARKLFKVLATKHPGLHWPAASTVADLLARRGLVQHRRRRRSPLHPGVVRSDTAAPNDLWSADFKGQFRTGDGQYCYPLTIADQHTRYLLTCQGVHSTQTVTARPVFERAFRAYGLPLAIRTDNGVPFATQAIHGLSYLNVWWMRLGILHQRIRPGCPQENGAHERMHRTFKREAIKPVRHSCRSQQRNFDAFQDEYNTERPHEALGQDTPASRYCPSVRAYPDRLAPLEYPGHFLVKKTTTGGTFRFRTRLLYLANAMVDQQIGLEETDDGIWAIHVNTVLLATFDERDCIITG
jgi:transposase InsO family protein